MSVVVIATIEPLPEHRDEVIAAFEATIARVHAEDEGCELYAMHEIDGRLVMIEKWTSAEALAVHGKGAALTDLGPRLAGKLTGASRVEVLQPHPAGTAAQGAL
jgi:quinol monooxygenase YgiN